MELIVDKTEVMGVLAHFTLDPISALERIADEVRKDRINGERYYAILAYDAPFQGKERKSFAEIGDLINVKKGRVSQILKGAYDACADYLYKFYPSGSGLGIPLSHLPWRKFSPEMGKKACNSLQEHFVGRGQEKKRDVLVREVRDYIHRCVRDGGPLMIRGYQREQYILTRTVFEEIGVALPDVEVMERLGGRIFIGK